MNFENKNNTLKIIISVGDESGVGPEIILKDLCSNQIPKNIDFTLVGSKKNLQNTYSHLRSLGLENLANPKNLKIYDLEIASSEKDSKSSYGNSSFYYLIKAIEIVKKYPNSALVTGPICKKSWSSAGHYFSGQTEVLAKSCGVKNVGMLFTAKSPFTGWRFNTLLATTHIALSEVPKILNTKLIHSKLDLFKDFCSTYINKPTFKVAGLNPHAGLKTGWFFLKNESEQSALKEFKNKFDTLVDEWLEGKKLKSPDIPELEKINPTLDKSKQLNFIKNLKKNF